MSDTVLMRARKRLWRARRIYRAEIGSFLRRERSHDGLPLPPARLRLLSVGTTKVDHFVVDGGNIAGLIRNSLARAGYDLDHAQAVLDFGAGAGRIARHFKALPGELQGTDVNPQLVRWCARNLPFGRFVPNDPLPPLPYLDETFDVVYSVSVFTHLTEELQRPWLDELRRVLRPRGYLLFTTHGDAFAHARLEPAELERFSAGELVVRRAEAVYTNACSAFHPRSYVRERLSDGFEVLEQQPGLGPDIPPMSGQRQDANLLRRA